MTISAKTKRIIISLVDIIGISAAALLRHFIPHIMDALPGCTLTANGFPCPACGGTRCVMNMLDLKLITAFGFNPYIFMLGLYLCFIVIIWNISWLFNNKKAARLLKTIANTNVIIIWGVLFLLFWAYRWIIQ